MTTRVSQEAEQRKIRRALKEANGDHARAADLLQVNFKTLTAKLRQFGLD